MALTLEEKHLCRQAAAGQAPRGDGWGSPALGLCPIGAVVTHRGGHLYLWPTGTYAHLPPPNQGPWCVNLQRLSPDERRTYETLTRLVAEVQAEVLAWSGHQHWRTFTEAIIAHGAAALPEA